MIGVRTHSSTARRTVLGCILVLGTLIGGSRYWCGSGSIGLGPYWVIGLPPPSSQEVSAAIRPITEIARNELIVMRSPPVSDRESR